MTNKPKAKGTSWESAVCKYLRKELEDERIERRALHGAKDMGDLFGLVAHGFSGIVECKAYSAWGQKDLATWQEQTLDERDNADAGFALLVVKVPRKGAGSALCYCTMRDLARMALPLRVNEGWAERADESWVCMTLAEACALMRGEQWSSE